MRIDPIGMSDSFSPRVADDDLAEIIALVGSKNQAAFQRLYLQTSAHLFGVLLRILKHEPAAEDALQETFMKIWRSADSYNPSLGRPFTWMTSIARYHALDVLRSTNASRARDVNYTVDTERLAEFPQQDNRIDIADAQLLSICLDRIDPRARQCVIEAYCEGYTHEELSLRRDTPLGTVKSWIRRALSTLKECIDDLS